MIIDKLKIVCYNRQKKRAKGSGRDADTVVRIVRKLRGGAAGGDVCVSVLRDGIHAEGSGAAAGHAGHALRAAAVRGIRERAGGRRSAAQVREAPLTPAASVPVAPSAALFLLIL